MSRVGGKNTTPEIRVRRAAHALGLRFRLHRSDLAGTPDLVFPRRRIALFVHGCFWHRHLGCCKASNPKTRKDYWEEKFRTNIARDIQKAAELEVAGWQVVVVWECETKKRLGLEQILRTKVLESRHRDLYMPGRESAMRGTGR